MSLNNIESAPDWFFLFQHIFFILFYRVGTNYEDRLGFVKLSLIKINPWFS